MTQQQKDIADAVCELAHKCKRKATSWDIDIQPATIIVSVPPKDEQAVESILNKHHIEFTKQQSSNTVYTFDRFAKEEIAAAGQSWQPMTVKRLYALCAAEIKKGNGDKEILLSNDDEGNGFHECYYDFTEDVAQYDRIDHPENKIILG